MFTAVENPVTRAAYNEQSGTWWKPASRHEQAIYPLITPHPRILAPIRFSEHYTELEYHPRGDLWAHLIAFDVPIRIRLRWALEIAEGLAHMHSRSVVWGDVHFGNVLVTEDDHVVLCDFGSATRTNKTRWPPAATAITAVDPSVFDAPSYLPTPTHADIFSFGVMLFALIALRFPWAEDITPCREEHALAAQNHTLRRFDTLEDRELAETFGTVLDGCFRGSYSTGRELLHALKGSLQDYWDDVNGFSV
ncbi:Protein kinase domain-containing protein [Mycena chlorophos]|uniref:Protein kinase domain-containing protein n=1 Tax=Mycena chlorophos TaxID=658473 RepID=A0A8H6W2W2_MYCCL|nr:Protein kinase domain-containing protein [Mycena chlorophos]